MDRVMELCLFHDIGEAVTGDIPAFEKTDSDEQREAMMLDVIADKLLSPVKKN
ncbi:MAG: HD domain-containing protein [Lachnoclostridium sp.]